MSDKLWEEVKENCSKLRSCNKHDFSIDITPDRTFGKKWQCANCKGTVDNLIKYWFELGYKQAKGGYTDE